MTRMTGPEVSPQDTGPRQDPLSQDPNSPVGFFTHPPTRGGTSLQIVEETISVRRYTAHCELHQQTFHHRDRKTLEHNINQHLVRYHGADMECRLRKQEIVKQLHEIQKRLNAQYGR